MWNSNRKKFFISFKYRKKNNYKKNKNENEFLFIKI